MEKWRGSSEMGMLCRLGFGLALSPDLASNFGLDFYTDEIQGGKRHGDLLALIHLKKMQTVYSPQQQQLRVPNLCGEGGGISYSFVSLCLVCST